MFSGTRGQTSPPLGQGWQHRHWCWNKRGKLLVFLFLQMLHRRFVLSAQRISPRKGKKPGGFFLAEECWPGKASSRLLQAGISPWSLTPHYLFSLNCCHQLCWALWEAASRAAPSSDTFLCTSDIHTVSHGVPPCGCRYSRAGWCILADLILLPAAATDFVLEGKKTSHQPSDFSACYKSKFSSTRKQSSF